jgi:hypothetical protein
MRMGSKRGAKGACTVCVLMGLLASQACRGPTQITVELTTDVRCADVRGTAITVGELTTIETKPAVAVTPACDPTTGRVGSMVIVPSGDRDEQVSFRVVMGLGRDPSECVAPAYGPGCIVARRALRFIPGQSLYVPIFLGTVCNGVPCEATQTCSGGSCASAVIDDSSRCAEPGGCDESTLGGVVPAPPGVPPVDVDAATATDASTLPPVPLDPVAGCGRPSTYVDDFSDGVIGPEWVVTSATAADTVAEVGGELRLRASAQASAKLESRFAVSFSDDRLRVEVPRPPSGGGTATLRARGPGGEMAFELSNGNLTTRVTGGGAGAALPFDPIAHRWWQIREAAGQLHWETSPDAIVWTTHATQATPTFARWAKISLEARAAAGAPTEAVFSRLNAGRPRAPWCKAATLTDDFAPGAAAPAWTAVVTGACSYTQNNGEVRFTMNGQGASYCAYESASAYDLTGSGAYLEIPAITNFHPPVRFFVGVEDATGKTATLSFVGTNQLEHAATGLASTLTNYTAATERWWRLREAGGSLLWETSSDGRAWTVKRQAAVPFALDVVRLELGVRTNATMPGAISIGTPRFNAGP